MQSPWLQDMGEDLVRAAHLLALVAAPTSLSPDPAPAKDGLVPAAAGLLLGGILVAAVRLRRGAEGREARAAATLAWLAVAAALVGAVVFRGPAGPLERGLPLVAPFAWGAVAMAVAAAAGRWLPEGLVASGPRTAASPGAERRYAWRRAAVASVVLVGAALAYLPARSYVLSTNWLWWEAVRRDGDHPLAMLELARPALEKRSFDQARDLAARCFTLHPEGCACRSLQADVEVHTRRLDEAALDARKAVDRCPTLGYPAAILAEALAQTGDATTGERLAREALVRGGGPDGELYYAIASAEAADGRTAEAKVDARKAVERGAGRDAKLLAGALEILTEDLDGAEKWLGPLLVVDPDDADAQYNLALVADKRSDFNHARQGYLATLKLDPRYASARYNVALLTLRAGALDEARHHAQRFAEAFPKDARGAGLTATVWAAKAGDRAPATGQPANSPARAPGGQAAPSP